MRLVNSFQRKLGRVLRETFRRETSSRSPSTPSPRQSQHIDRVFCELSQYALEHRTACLRTEVIAQCKKALIDCIASIWAGSTTIEARTVSSDHYLNLSNSQLPGPSALNAMRQVSFTLACLSQIYDYNDGYPTTGIYGSSFHPGRVIIPCALAVACGRSLSGGELLRSVALGYDIALGTQFPPLQGSCDAIGAAAISSQALGFDVNQTALALKIACFLAPRTGGDDFELNHLTCAQQAASAWDAARLVEAGYPPTPVPSRYADQFRFVRPEYAGQTMLDLYFKPYPCCRYIHPLIELGVKVHEAIKCQATEIREMSIKIPASQKGPDLNFEPAYVGKTLQFNFPFCVAAAVVTGGLRLTDFDPKSDLHAKICSTAVGTRCSFVDHDEASIEVACKDGSRISRHASVSSPLGGRDNPLNAGQHQQKLARVVQNEAVSQAILQMIGQIEDPNNVAMLCRIIADRLRQTFGQP